MEFTAEMRRVLAHDGHGALDVESASRLWGALLDGALDDVEIGAMIGAMSVRGDTVDGLLGLHRAVQSRLSTLAVGEGVVAIPAYGLFAGEAQVVALAAMLLRRFDLRVIVHGVLDAACGVSCARVLRELDVLPSASLPQAQAELAERGIAFVPVHLLSPAFARLLALRARLGVETPAHGIAPLIDPAAAGAIRIVPSMGGARGSLIDAIVARTQGDVLRLTWSGGDCAANLMLRPRIERCHAGVCERLFEADARDLRVPALLALDDACSAAAIVRAITTGRVPVPMPTLNLAAACLYATGRAPDFARAKAAAAVAGGRLAA